MNTGRHAVRALSVSASILTVTLMTGCASMLNKGGSTVVIGSNPPGASVFRNGTEVGTTPYQYQYLKEHGNEVLFELRKPGFESGELKVSPRMKGIVLFADAMLFHLPYIVDGRSKDLYHFPAKQMNTNLFKEVPDDLSTLPLPVSGVELGSMDDMGTIDGSSIRIKLDGLWRSFNYESGRVLSVVNGAKGSYCEATHARIGTKTGGQEMRRAKYHLRPLIKRVKMDLRKKQGQYYGPVDLSIDWRLYSSVHTDSLLFNVPKEFSYQATNDRTTVLNNALEAAVKDLLSDPELHPKLLEARGSAITMSKGEQVNIPLPVTIDFEGRREMLSKLVAGVVTIKHDEGHGSGFIISNTGHIMTNQHVVEGKDEVEVTLHQGITLNGEVLKTNPDMDLALIKVTATDLPALELGDETGLLIGEEMFAIGTPMDQQLGQSVSRGILSGKREIDGRQFLQTDVSINPGNSGGPMIDESGKVVGVTTMKLLGDGVEGLGFGVPIRVALEMLNINMTAQ